MAFILNIDASAASLPGHNPLSSRVISINLKRTSLLNLAVIQADAPTATAQDDKTKHNQMQKLLESCSNARHSAGFSA